MNKTILTFLTFFVYSLSNAQNNPVALFLTSDRLNLIEDEANPIEISSDGNFTLSGVFDSETSILLKASADKSIKLIPKDAVFSPSNSGVLIDPPASAVRIKSPGGIRPPTSRTTINIYPNPVQNDLTFTSNDLVTEYAIYDLTGLLKLSQKTEPTKTAKINVSELKTANYILVLNLGNGKQLSIQFIKN
jgi:Secretion system C-terminal sorting domain